MTRFVHASEWKLFGMGLFWGVFLPAKYGMNVGKVRHRVWCCHDLAPIFSIHDTRGSRRPPRLLSRVPEAMTR